MPTETIVFSEEEEPRPWLRARTLRALGRLGHPARVVSREGLASALVRARGIVWLLREGAVPDELPRLARSLTGRPVLAFGATRGDPAWRRLTSTTGGDLRSATTGLALPVPHSVLLERPSALSAALDAGATVHEATRRALAASRAVVLAGQEVRFSAGLRVLVAVTTLHRGGAERVAADLARGLPEHALEVVFAVMDEARRETLVSSPPAVHLHERGRDRDARLQALLSLAREELVDVVSAHLLDGAELDALAASDLPTVLTLHNARPGWQEGTAACRVTAVVACSRAVANDARAAGLSAPVRVAFNGVDGAWAPSDPAARASLGVDARALVLVAVANARPQKRLERAVGVLSRLVEKGADAHLVLVGAPLVTSPASLAASRAVDDAAASLGVHSRVHRVGSAPDVTRWLAAADVMLSTSAWEGMSLAHLEGLAAGLPVVTSEVGGVDEIARAHPGRIVRVAVDASDAAFADAVTSVATGRSTGRLARPFTTADMVARHAFLLDRVCRPARSGPVWLITNNFATGGAQSSARRLLLGLRARGVDVRAAVLQEQLEYPTEGRAALERAGLEVLVAPRAEEHDAEVTVGEVLAAIDREGARAVLFWNVIAEHKVLLADALMGARVFDVSPGEMLFASLDRYLRGPRSGSTILDGRDYGGLLAGVVVKYAAEATRAAEVLGAPVSFIPNGVEPWERPPRVVEAPLVVGTLARLSPDKKLEQLVAATAAAVKAGARGFEVHVAGAVETGCEAWALDLERSCAGLPIRFVGHKPAHEFLSTLDVFAMISEPLGCPNASLEAMASGLPVIATDAGGAHDQLRDGAGVLVPRGDADALGRELALLLSAPERRAALGAAALGRVRERFSLRRMVDDYSALVGL